MIRLLAADLFVALVVIYAAISLITQIIIPLIQGTKLFPWFTREREIAAKMREVNQALKEEDAAKELAERQKILEEKRNKPTPPSEQTK